VRVNAGDPAALRVHPHRDPYASAGCDENRLEDLDDEIIGV
jgi:hypothetical protein